MCTVYNVSLVTIHYAVTFGWFVLYFCVTIYDMLQAALRPVSSACSLSVSQAGSAELEIVLRCANAKLVRVLQDRSMLISWARDAPSTYFHSSLDSLERLIQFKPLFTSGSTTLQPQNEYFFQVSVPVRVPTHPVKCVYPAAYLWLSCKFPYQPDSLIPNAAPL